MCLRLRSSASAATPLIHTPHTVYQIYNSWYMLFFQLPLLPEIWFRARSHFGLRKLWRDWSPGHTPDPAAFASLEATFGEPGTRYDLTESGLFLRGGAV